MSLTTLGIDIAKNVFHVHGRDAAGTRVFRSSSWALMKVKVMANLSRCRVGWKCAGARTIGVARSRRWAVTLVPFRGNS